MLASRMDYITARKSKLIISTQIPSYNKFSIHEKKHFLPRSSFITCTLLIKPVHKAKRPYSGGSWIILGRRVRKLEDWTVKNWKTGGKDCAVCQSLNLTGAG